MSKEFWKYALIRALRTLCQTAIASIGTAAVLSEVNWIAVLSASVLAALLSILTSISTGLPEVETGQTTFNEDTLEEMTEEDDDTDNDPGEE
jgi:hypothetical protein